ncbi:hypothetical protein NC651_040416 [Populus alba x Populus x berolinensis]|nr:hypothetical protein NC651_040416 [Populus alba x Populus x berolinensis]
MGELRVTMTRKMHGVCYWITGEKYVKSNYLGREKSTLIQRILNISAGNLIRSRPRNEMKVIIALEAIIDVIQMLFHPIVLSCVALSLKSIFFLTHDS